MVFYNFAGRRPAWKTFSALVKYENFLNVYKTSYWKKIFFIIISRRNLAEESYETFFMDSAIRGNRDARSFCAIELSCPVCAGAIGGNAMQTKKAIGNLLNRYRAVLKKCHLLNTFGTLALASAFILGGAASYNGLAI